MDDQQPDPMQDERRCRATSKRSGVRCRNFPLDGATVCRMHGGKAPQVQAAAEQRQTEKKAAEALAKLWPEAGLAGLPPTTDPIGLLARVASALEHMADSVGERVNALNGRVAAGEHMAQLRAEVVLLERVLGHLAKVSTDMARLNIAERQLEVDQALAELVVGAFLASIEPLALVPADRSAAVGRFLDRLGTRPALPELQIVTQEDPA